MNTNSVNWIPDGILEENKRASVSMYKSIENDFVTCLEYVALTEKHLSVYSIRLGNLILRIGPELLRQLNIVLFDPERSASFHFNCLKPLLIELQNKCNQRKDSFMDYYNVLSEVEISSISKNAVKVKPLDKYILPFELEFRKGRKVIPWWEDGYNASRHRIINEFKVSATLGNALLSLSALWFLHYEFDQRYPHSFYSEIFEDVKDKDSNDVQKLGCLKLIKNLIKA